MSTNRAPDHLTYLRNKLTVPVNLGSTVASNKICQDNRTGRKLMLKIKNDRTPSIAASLLVGVGSCIVVILAVARISTAQVVTPLECCAESIVPDPLNPRCLKAPLSLPCADCSLNGPAEPIKDSYCGFRLVWWIFAKPCGRPIGADNSACY